MDIIFDTNRHMLLDYVSKGCSLYIAAYFKDVMYLQGSLKEFNHEAIIEFLKYLFRITGKPEGVIMDFMDLNIVSFLNKRNVSYISPGKNNVSQVIADFCGKTNKRR